ncbi:ribosome hibernation-promoting factor, HPF/YfiA family [Jiangella anatolica]|uniref:ribosome hibernation-promoting factor, HPF/YfiA family n=1 Tax=Jiangella anatolica TaxID=2670374 RepID=UPI0018F3B9F6|nr:ribosome-associated translation inhibitor RaiA [Jiangella anatolica]
MDIVIKGRHTTVPERFRNHVTEKLAKLDKIAHKVIRVDVEVTAEANPRQTDHSERVELTLHSKGPVIRAEAAAADRYAALDLATDKLIGRLRKAADRRRVHRGNRTPISVAAATAGLDGGAIPAQPTPAPVAVTVVEEPPDAYAVPDTGPMVVREKTHRAEPMTLDQALYEMELVGHDFYLYVDADSKMPSVVYRRRGYDYGVIRLDV